MNWVENDPQFPKSGIVPSLHAQDHGTVSGVNFSGTIWLRRQRSERLAGSDLMSNL
jgi:hypothetical protein